MVSIKQFTIYHVDGSHTYLTGNWISEVDSGSYRSTNLDEGESLIAVSAPLTSVIKVEVELVQALQVAA